MELEIELSNNFGNLFRDEIDVIITKPQIRGKSMKRELICTIGIMFVFSCNNNRKIINESEQETYSKAEIYCYCVAEDSIKNQVFINTCSTSFSIHPKELVKPDKLFYSTSNKLLLNQIKELFFNKRNKMDTLIRGVDARFLILLKKNEFKADTLVFRDEYSFSFNGKFNINFSFQMMDSLRSILNRKVINCN